MKIGLIVWIGLILVGCGGASKRGGSAENPLFSGSGQPESQPVSERSADPDRIVENLPESEAAPEIPVAEEASRDQYSNLAEALKNQNEGRVLSSAGAILGKNAKDQKALNAMGVYYYRTGRPEMARLLWARALKDNPNSPSLANNMGLLMLRDDKPELAVREFRKALSQNSSHWEASANLGALHLKFLNYEAAKTYLSEAYEDRPKDVAVAVNYAIALRGLGQLDEAKRIYERLGAEKSDQTLVLFNYAVLLIEYLNDKSKGLEVINKVRYYQTDTDIMKRANQLAERAQQIN